jgi:hypothetical protein
MNLEENYRDKLVRKLEAIQKRAAKLTTIVFKTVSRSALDVEAFLLPSPYLAAVWERRERCRVFSRVYDATAEAAAMRSSKATPDGPFPLLF